MKGGSRIIAELHAFKRQPVARKASAGLSATNCSSASRRDFCAWVIVGKTVL